MVGFRFGVRSVFRASCSSAWEVLAGYVFVSPYSQVATWRGGGRRIEPGLRGETAEPLSASPPAGLRSPPPASCFYVRLSRSIDGLPPG